MVASAIYGTGKLTRSARGLRETHVFASSSSLCTPGTGTRQSAVVAVRRRGSLLRVAVPAKQGEEK